MNYVSTLAELIQSAVNECIGYGRGEVRSQDGENVVRAEWAENEDDIEVSVHIGNYSVEYTEKGVAGKVYGGRYGE